MHHKPKNRGVYVDNQKFPFYEVVNMYNRLHHCVPLVKMVKKTYMERPIWGPDERVMPLRKYINYQYYRFEITGTTGLRRFGVNMNYRYCRWMVVPVLPMEPDQKYR
jgi:hypothetical protein